MSPRIARRALLGLAAPRRRTQPEAVTVSQYGGWIAQYRRGRFAAAASGVRDLGARELLSAQRRYLRALSQAQMPGARPPFEGRRRSVARHGLRVVRTTLAAALFHAEIVARSGEGAGDRLRLVGTPLDELPTNWPPLAPAGWREAAREAWGDRRTNDFRALVRREVFLMAARSRLARLDNRTARAVLGFAGTHRDPAVEWQLAVTDTIQARYLGDEHLWSEIQRGLTRGVRNRDGSPEDLGAARRPVVGAMGDPDDLHLRLALAALARRRYRAAAGHLEEVRSDAAPRLRIPRLLLLAELDLRQRRPRSAVESLRTAIRQEPTSPAAMVALVAALQAAGRWDEAAKLASGSLGVADRERPWLGFITAWAEFGEGLPWLRGVAGIG